MSYTYGPSDPAFSGDLDDVDQLRLLLNDIDISDSGVRAVFTDEEIKGVLALEGGAIKLAAAQLIDTNADNELLASKVLRTQDLQTDGSKVAQLLHSRAEQLRTQHATAIADEGFFGIVEAPHDRHCPPAYGF